MDSNVLAERKAWEITDAQQRWQLITINPDFVLGPGTTPNQKSGSFERFPDLDEGACKGGIPRKHIGMVDIRDIAEAHFRAGFYAGAHGRYIVSEVGYSHGDIVGMRARLGDDYPFPAHQALPDEIAQFICDNSKSVNELALTRRSIAPGLEEMFEHIVSQTGPGS